MVPNRPGGRPGRAMTPRIRPSQVVAVILILALFTVAVVVAGIIGALLVGLIAVAAGVLLLLRWPLLDPRVRIFRAVVVLAALAVAVSLWTR